MMDSAKTDSGVQRLDDELLGQVSGGVSNPRSLGTDKPLGSKYSYRCETCRHTWTAYDLVPQTVCPNPACTFSDVVWVKLS